MIMNESFKKEIKVAVFPPSAFFVFDEKVDFGYVEESNLVTKELIIKNEGCEWGDINLAPLEKYVTLEPS